jgi:pyruvate-ferredoxin/flavodoxin oxidoreductase
VYRRCLVETQRSFIPDFGVYIRVQGTNGDAEYRALSRQLVMFCVERRKAWRMLQSKAGIENREYKAQRSVLADVDAGKIPMAEFFARADELLKERLPRAGSHAPAKPMSRPTVPAAAAQKPQPSPDAEPSPLVS